MRKTGVCSAREGQVSKGQLLNVIKPLYQRMLKEWKQFLVNVGVVPHGIVNSKRLVQFILLATFPDLTKFPTEGSNWFLLQFP